MNANHRSRTEHKPSARLVGTLASVCLGVAAAPACGDLANEDTKPEALAVIHGELSSASPESEGRVAMAVFWNALPYAEAMVAPPDAPTTPLETFSTEECEPVNTDKEYYDGRPWQSGESCVGHEFHLDELTETVSYEPEFPLRFSIPITRLPPEKGSVDLSRYGGHGTFAMGSVVAFVDQDGNGKFDFGRRGVEPEEPIASSLVPHPEGPGGKYSNFWVVYLDGEIDVAHAYEGYRDTLAMIPQGFSLWHKLETPAVDPADRPLRERTILPIDADVSLLGEPALAESEEFCTDYSFDLVYKDKPFEEEYGAWFCSEDGLTVESVQDSKSIGDCRYESEGVKISIRDVPADQRPSDWPCTIE